MTRPVTIYLAGAMRDRNADDRQWREMITQRLASMARVLNPYTTVQHMGGRAMVKQDYWSVDAADVVVCNLTALTEQYPCIGTLTEIGYAVARGKLIYVVLPRGYRGHNYTGFSTHPFIEENAAAVFATVEECADFLETQVPALGGR